METLFHYSIITLFASLFGIAGGLLFRVRGTDVLMRPFPQVLFSSIYIYHAVMLFGVWIGFNIGLLTVIMVSRGHGRSMDLGLKPNSQQEPEWYEGIILPLSNKMSEYWYDFIGLMVSGVTYTLPLGLFLADPTSDHFWYGIALILTGALKGPAYAIGDLLNRKLLDQGDIDNLNSYYMMKYFPLKGSTEFGEFFTGLFLWASAIIVFSELALSH